MRSSLKPAGAGLWWPWDGFGGLEGRSILRELTSFFCPVLQKSSKILFCIFLEGEPAPRPQAALLCLDGSSLVSASPPFPEQQPSEPAPWNSGKVLEAEGGPFPKNKKQRTQKSLCAQELHRAWPCSRTSLPPLGAEDTQNPS